MGSNNVRRQNLRNFTVRIRHATESRTVGTGIIVSRDGNVVTCAHVVKEACIEERVAKDVEVRVCFSQVSSGETKIRQAKVAAYFDDDDVVLLQLVGEPPILSPEQIAVLGTAELSQGNAFRSYGYRELDQSLSGWVEGKIMGSVEHCQRKYLKADPIELRSRDIRPGISGAAVLDVERNLVVGIIRRRWNPGDSCVDDNIGWAVDARVLTFDPMNLPVQDAPLPLRPAPLPQKGIDAGSTQAVSPPSITLSSAPPPLAEWVGREELRQLLSNDWADPERRVTGLIGFGGEGKSSLARRWLDDLRQDKSQPQPQDVFWWSFYEKRNVDEFFEAALTHIGGGQIDPGQYLSTNAQAHIIAAMLSTGRYLFVLDGLEVLQHQSGESYGILTSNDLRQFLGYFAASGHKSFCLITSRAPVLDLIDYTTYTHRDVDRLSLNEGRALLQKIDVKGSDAALDRVVQDWDGHALTLSLLAAYLVDFYQGDVAQIKDIPAPSADAPVYEQVSRVLHRYDEHFTEAEREFLMVFSAFRLPIQESALEPVFGVQEVIVRRLVNYRILRDNPQENYYTTHPLIRTHYLERLKSNPTQFQAVHKRIADYYLSIAGETPENPTLEDLAPLIEAVHHLCQARDYDEASCVCGKRIYQRENRVLVDELGAYETAFELMREFFPNGDTCQEPQLSNLNDKSYILNEVGLCLMSLGRIGEAPPFYERSNAIGLSKEDWENVSLGYQNLAQLYIHLGQLPASADAAHEALILARRGSTQEEERTSLAWQAWIAHLQGDLEAADVAFHQAERLEREIGPDERYLWSLRGIHHADHLRRANKADYARQVTEVNLEICELNHWLEDISQCYRVLGDLDADAGNHDNALQHYNQAIKIARNITVQEILIEALLSRGRWAARHGEVDAARSDLEEALNYAVTSGYRIYEADIRVALAWIHLAAGNSSTAQTEAEKAQRMSAEMGYHWGQVDAAEVLAAFG